METSLFSLVDHAARGGFGNTSTLRYADAVDCSFPSLVNDSNLYRCFFFTNGEQYHIKVPPLHPHLTLFSLSGRKKTIITGCSEVLHSSIFQCPSQSARHCQGHIARRMQCDLRGNSAGKIKTHRYHL